MQRQGGALHHPKPAGAWKFGIWEMWEMWDLGNVGDYGGSRTCEQYSPSAGL